MEIRPESRKRLQDQSLPPTNSYYMQPAMRREESQVKDSTISDGTVSRAVKVLALPCIAAAILAAGCGSDDNGDSGGTTTSSKAASGKSSPASGESSPRATNISGKSETEMEADDNYFKPAVLTGKPGQSVTLNLKNEGQAEHTFTIASQKVDKELKPDATATVRVKLPASGSVQFICRYHADQGMRGSLAVGKATSGGSSSSSGGSSSGSGSGY
jgi:plastocyanin